MESLNAIAEVAEDYKKNGFRVEAKLEDQVYYKIFATLVGSFICIALVGFMLRSLTK
jgi:hypothetical protein